MLVHQGQQWDALCSPQAILVAGLLVIGLNSDYRSDGVDESRCELIEPIQNRIHLRSKRLAGRSFVIQSELKYEVHADQPLVVFINHAILVLELL